LRNKKLRFARLVLQSGIALALMICMTYLLIMLVQELVNLKSNEALTALLGGGLMGLGQALQRVVGALSSRESNEIED
jgi:uncharacterized membrane-anchored protein YitT (DUF2179 family)